MSKIICDVCGTSYPETASQCPICGCVRSADAQAVASDATVDETAASAGYTYVKGGRFSKANVRKRNKKTQNAGAAAPVKKKVEDDDKSNKGLVITAVVLLLAIIAVLIYIILHFFGPAPSGGKTDPTDSTPSNTITEPADSTPAVPEDIACQDIVLDVQTVTFDKVNAARMLSVTLSPADTTDEVTFTSSDDSIATVTKDGKITAVAPGQAVITITCGNVVKECKVECTFEEPTEATTEATEPATEPTEPTTEPTEPAFVLTLNRFDITFKNKGDSWVLYDGNVSVASIKWSSANPNIATFARGKVVAVGSGTTKVYAEYEGQKVSCIIRCSFEDTEDPTISGSGGGITEDGGETTATTPAGGPYKLKNTLGGGTDDVSLNSGKSFVMQLVDSAGNPVSGVTWVSSDTSICTVSGGKITAVSSGMATVTASYDGNTFTCIIRVR